MPTLTGHPFKEVKWLSSQSKYPFTILKFNGIDFNFSSDILTPPLTSTELSLFIV